MKQYFLNIKSIVILIIFKNQPNTEQRSRHTYFIKTWQHVISCHHINIGSTVGLTTQTERKGEKLYREKDIHGLFQLDSPSLQCTGRWTLWRFVIAATSFPSITRRSLCRKWLLHYHFLLIFFQNSCSDPTWLPRLPQTQRKFNHSSKSLLPTFINVIITQNNHRWCKNWYKFELKNSVIRLSLRTK